MSTNRQFLSVHDSHCCPKHGCKYGDASCPVVLGLEYGIECEDCSYDQDDPEYKKQAELKNKYEDLALAYESLRLQIANTNTLEELNKLKHSPIDPVRAYSVVKLKHLTAPLKNAKRLIQNSTLLNNDLSKIRIDTLKRLSEAINLLERG